MRFIASVIDKLQRHPKRIVFPEGTEPRVLLAARQFHSLRLGVPILLGDRGRIKALAESLNVSIEGIRIIDPEYSDDLPAYVARYERLRRLKGVEESDARSVVVKPNFFGAMMVAMHGADGFVSGTNEISGSVLRPLFQIIKVAPQATTASSCLIIEVPDSRFGESGVMFLADCGVIPEPTVEQLAEIAISTARLARQLLGTRPRVGMLSFSTRGSSRHGAAGRVAAATALAQQLARETGLDVDIDGELQVDAALIPEIAARKLPDSRVAGRANVLIFPDLNSGNIASKMVQHIARGNAYGQILLGLDRPAADVSRGSNAHDILGVAAVVGLQSIEYSNLYPEAGPESAGRLGFLMLKNVATPRVFVAATRMNDGKTTTSLGLLSALQQHHPRVGYIKPVGQRFVEVEEQKIDEDSVLMQRVYQIEAPLVDMSPIAVEPDFTRRYLESSNNESLVRRIEKAFDRVSWEKDFVLCEGTGHAGVGAVFDLSNATVARLLHAKVVIVTQGGIGKPIDEVAMNQALYEREGVQIIGVILNKVLPGKLDYITNFARKGLKRRGLELLGVIPHQPILSSPTVAAIREDLEADILNSSAGINNIVERVVLGAMSVHHAMNHFTPGALVIAPGDREDILLAAGASLNRSDLPGTLAGIVLTDNVRPSAAVMRIVREMPFPVLLAEGDIYEVASRVHDLNVKTRPADTQKIQVIRNLVGQHVDLRRILNAL